jgi:hypothetical protein
MLSPQWYTIRGMESGYQSSLSGLHQPCSSAMALATSRAGRLEPEIKLAQTLSEYEAILDDEQKSKLRGYRQESPPTTADVMRLTADIDQDARTRKSRSIMGPKVCNFLQGVQMFTGVVDVIIGGSQVLIASWIWGAVKLSLQVCNPFKRFRIPGD